MTTINSLPHERENAWKLGGKVGERRGTKGPGMLGKRGCMSVSKRVN